MNYCFTKNCTNIALQHLPCRQCPEGHYICTECINNTLERQNGKI